MIRLENVSYSYPGQEATKQLHEVDLKINRGEIILLCGASGCGKSTILRLINGLIPHFYEGEVTGQVQVLDLPVSEIPIQRLAPYVGSVFQNPKSQFFSSHSTGELAFACENIGMPVKEIEARIEAVAQSRRLGPLLDRPLATMSGGERQLWACQTATINDAAILVLDEPSANLDGDAIETLRQQLIHWRSQGKTIIIAEHRLYYLRELLDRCCYIRGGRVEGEYSGDEFRRFTDHQLAEKGLRPAKQEWRLPQQSRKTAGHSLQLEELAFRYKRKEPVAFQCQQAQITSGQVTAIIGKNGSGKSTLARVLCGLEKKHQGNIYLNGVPISPKQALEASFMVMQDVERQLFTESVLEEVLLSMTDPDEEAALDLLEQLNLQQFAESHPLALSGGQKQRLAIASALAADKQLFIFDEPTSGLDHFHMQQVAKLLQELAAKDKFVLVITHDRELLESSCQEALWVHEGQFQEQLMVCQENEGRLTEIFQ